jgi:hypothetical protein
MSKQNPLSPEIANQIGGAIQRLSQLSESKIVTQESDAEKAGLTNFLQRVVVEHADELIASWYAVRMEYEPLVNGFAGLMARASGILKRKEEFIRQHEAAKAAEAAEQQQPTPDNVVPLIKP